MKTLLRELLFTNWQRKAISLLIAVILWVIVNDSLTMTKTLPNIPVRVINLSANKTMEGLQPSGILNKRISLTLVGNKTLLDEISPNDLEVVIDAADKPDEWITTITKKNLSSLNPECDLSSGVSKVYHQSLSMRTTKLITEKIPIRITEPVGEAPRGYQFLDIWPYHLTVTVSGSEDVIKRLKSKEHRLTFNLNDVAKAQLDAIQMRGDGNKGEVISFFIPDQWKQVSIPSISDSPIEIDDPIAKGLRIDFTQYNLLPLNTSIPLSLFISPQESKQMPLDNCSFAPSNSIETKNGHAFLSTPLYAKGVSRLFLDIVKDRIEIAVIVAEKNTLEWSVQFINPRELEDKYVAAHKPKNSDEEGGGINSNLRENYLRNRFRSYMNRFQLFKNEEQKFTLRAELLDNLITLQEQP